MVCIREVFATVAVVGKAEQLVEEVGKGEFGTVAGRAGPVDRIPEAVVEVGKTP